MVGFSDFHVSFGCCSFFLLPMVGRYPMAGHDGAV